MSGGEELEQAEGSLETRVSASLADAQAGRLTGHQSPQALMEHLEREQETVGRVMPEAVTDPAAWPGIRLGDICKIVRGVSYKKDQASDQPAQGKVPILRATNIQDGALVLDSDLVYVPADVVSEEQLLCVGDIVVATSSGSKHLVGKTAQVKDAWAGSFGAFCAALRPKMEIDHRYLGYFFGSKEYKDYITKRALGVNINNLRRGDLEEILVPVAPIDQQKRIVAEIEKQFSRLDEAVANLKRVKANLKRYKAAVLKAAVEGRLVETEAELARREGRSFETGEQLLQRILETRRSQWKGKGKYKEPAAPDTTDLPELPEGWVWASVDQLVAHLTDGDHQAPPQTDQGIPFLVIGNVRSGEIDFSDTRFVGEAYYNSLDPNRQPRLGDLLYTLVGSYGIPVRVTTEKSFCIQRHMAILRPHEHSPMSYLTLAMASDNILKQATAVATGTAQMTVPLAGLRRIAIPLPPPAEQHRIVAEVDRRLSLLRDTEAQVDANLQRAERLRQSILSRAFSGGFA